LTGADLQALPAEGVGGRELAWTWVVTPPSITALRIWSKKSVSAPGEWGIREVLAGEEI
jgi:hypothetical protein